MNIYNIINEFIQEQEYLENKHCLGIVFCGSYLTGLATEKSDVDLQIIFDDSDQNHLIRGNSVINGIRIEYFEKPLKDFYLQAINGHKNQDNAVLTIVGKGKVIFEKDGILTRLQNDIKEIYAIPMEPINIVNATEKIDEISTNISHLTRLSHDNNPYFESLFNITIEKIAQLYHKKYALPNLETSKNFKLYSDKIGRYKEIYSFDKTPSKDFIDSYFELVCSSNLDNATRISLITAFFNYVKKDMPYSKELNYKQEKKEKPPLSCAGKSEQVSIINNRMEKLEELAITNSPYFNYFFHIVVNRLFKLYNSRLGTNDINPETVANQYTDIVELKLLYDICYDPKFIDMYKDLLSSTTSDTIDRYNRVVDFYRYVTRGINLGDNYRIPILTRTIQNDEFNNQYVKHIVS